MQRLPILNRPVLSVGQRAHLAEIGRIAAEAHQARAERAHQRQVNEAVEARRAADNAAWAEGVVRGFARAEAEGRERARVTFPRGEP